MARHISVTVGSFEAAPPDPPPEGWPTAETTGSSGTLTPSSDTGLSGTTYDSLEFTAPDVEVYAAGAFTNCKFNGKVVVFGDGATFTDCDFNAFGAISCDNVTVTRGRWIDFGPDDAIQIGSGDGSNMLTNMTLLDCFISNGIPNEGGHMDTFQMLGTDGVHIDHCWFDLEPNGHLPQHNAAIVSETFGGTRNENFVIEDSYLKGGGYTCYLADGSGLFQNNTVTMGVLEYLYPDVGAEITGAGNVKAEDGTPLVLHP